MYPNSKRCTDCGETLPLDQFHKNKSSSDGRSSRLVVRCVMTQRRSRCEQQDVPTGKTSEAFCCPGNFGKSLSRKSPDLSESPPFMRHLHINVTAFKHNI